MTIPLWLLMLAINIAGVAGISASWQSTGDYDFSGGIGALLSIILTMFLWLVYFAIV